MKKRACFDNFAKKKGFDPKNVDNWYSVNVDEIEADQVDWDVKWEC